MGKLLLVGCGKMGGAMLDGWLARGLAASDIVVAEPVEALRPGKQGLRSCRRRRGPARRREIVVLAVKPQSMDAALADLRRFADAGRGVPVDRRRQDAELFRQPSRRRRQGRALHAQHAGGGAPGHHGCHAPRPPSTAAEKKRCHELLEAVGQVLWVEDEALIDPVTALSGSGPAYVFLLVEAMAAAGAKLGLSPDMAMQLARATVAGSGELLRQSSEPAAQLRVNVTSPGGTTAEALKVLMAADGIQPVFDKALAAASRRSKELAG